MKPICPNCAHQFDYRVDLGEDPPFGRTKTLEALIGRAVKAQDAVLLSRYGFEYDQDGNEIEMVTHVIDDMRKARGTPK